MCGCHKCQTCHVASRTSQTVREACRNRIGAEDVYDRYRETKLAYLRNSRALRDDNVDGKFNQFPASSGTRSTTSFP